MQTQLSSLTGIYRVIDTAPCLRENNYHSPV